MNRNINFNTHRNKKLAIIIIFVAIVYGINPVDLIPDVVVGIGQADDIIILLGALCNAWLQFRKQS